MSKHKKPQPLTPMSGEKWKPIEDFPPYEVSNFGRVRNVETMTEKRYYIDANGNPVMKFTKEHQLYTRGLTKLVGDAFIPQSKHFARVKHKDGNKTNCRADNLEFLAVHTVNGRESLAVVCIESGEIFASLTEAARDVRISTSCICRAIDTDKTAASFHWRSATPEEIKIVRTEDKLLAI